MSINEFVTKLSRKLNIPSHTLSPYTDAEGRHKLHINGITFSANNKTRAVTAMWGDGHKAVITL